MRRAARTDANQADIVDALRAIGASVEILAAVGRGCPDLLVGYRGCNVLLEVKDGQKRPSKRKLTGDQEIWHRGWQGRVIVVKSADEALAVVQGTREAA